MHASALLVQWRARRLIVAPALHDCRLACATPPLQPNKNPDTGAPAAFGTRDPKELFGPEGWCRAKEPDMPDPCPCIMDGYCGRFCDRPCEPFCPNQCSGGGLATAARDPMAAWPHVHSAHPKACAWLWRCIALQ